jgi:hypothetical protein
VAGSTSSSTTTTTTTEPDTTTGDSSAAVCECFDTSDGRFRVTCPFTGHTQCGNYQHCWDYGGGSSSGGESCPSPGLEAANAEVVECVLTLLASGGPGLFGDFGSDDIGQYSYGDDYVANGDGTLVVWSSETQDLDHEVSAVELRSAPSSTAVESCAARDTTEEQWSCIEAVARSGTRLETCTEAVSWNDI